MRYDSLTKFDGQEREILPSRDELDLYLLSYGVFTLSTPEELEKAMEMWEQGAAYEDITKVLTMNRFQEMYTK